MDKNQKKEEALKKMRHSAAHVLAAAILNLYPSTKLGIGPAIEDGFYYDFEFPKPISEKDLEKISKFMKKIIGKKLPFVKKEISIKEAKKIFKDQPYKLDLISEMEKQGIQKVSIYKTGNFLDLCSGPHVKNTENIGPFKLLSLAGAYWRGNENNPMLTRIYGTCFPTKKELEEYLNILEEARKRDHRKIGKDLGLFIIPEEVGAGLIIWTPKGAVIRREIENFIIKEQMKRGYQHVYSPHIGKKSLWITSGHWELYQDSMYSPIKIDKEEYLIKPMNCPLHMMIYKSQIRSYKELPLRIAENATVYRYEKKGELSGMIRVRHITQDDAHIFCTEEQVVSEFLEVIDYIMFLLKTFKISDFSFRLSLRDPKNKNKYLGDDAIWQKAEEKIEKAIKKSGLSVQKFQGEAAFYGPKLDVLIKDSLGRKWQCGTIQIDFMLPQRFNLEYIDKNGKPKRPILIHRAPLGSIERWVGILIEHYNGAFPVWLSPVQVKIIPISDKQIKYAQEIAIILKEKEIRVEIDERKETASAKIRSAEIEKIPYMIIVGEKEEKEKNISLRKRGEINLGKMTLDEFSDKIKKEVENKSIS